MQFTCLHTNLTPYDWVVCSNLHVIPQTFEQGPPNVQTWTIKRSSEDHQTFKESLKRLM
jgi:hypothetical protein